MNRSRTESPDFPEFPASVRVAFCSGLRDGPPHVQRRVNDTSELLERAKGFEPSTPTLARLCSTPELHPHPTASPPAALMAQRSPECNTLFGMLGI